MSWRSLSDFPLLVMAKAILMWSAICADHAPMVRWWRNEVPNKHAEDDERSLVGKPPVRFRKVVNTTTDDGRVIGVNAQQYAVLVMDVPNLARERAKCVASTHSRPISK